MPAPPLPENESQRLSSMRASGLLMRGPDPRLDAIVRRATLLYATPIAAVTLLDRQHQWFKASVGLGVPHTSRVDAFCGYAILQEDPLVVLDATTDARFSDNPLVLTEPGIRFYAGASVFGVEGLPLGALCVIDVVKRTSFDAAAGESLLAMAGEVTAIFAGG